MFPAQQQKTRPTRSVTSTAWVHSVTAPFSSQEVVTDNIWIAFRAVKREVRFAYQRGEAVRLTVQIMVARERNPDVGAHPANADQMQIWATPLQSLMTSLNAAHIQNNCGGGRRMTSCRARLMSSLAAWAEIVREPPGNRLSVHRCGVGTVASSVDSLSHIVASAARC